MYVSFPFPLDERALTLKSYVVLAVSPVFTTSVDVAGDGTAVFQSPPEPPDFAFADPPAPPPPPVAVIDDTVESVPELPGCATQGALPAAAPPAPIVTAFDPGA